MPVDETEVTVALGGRIVARVQTAQLCAQLSTVWAAEVINATLELPATAFSQHVTTCSILAADVRLTRLFFRSTIIALPLHRQYNTTQHWTTALHTRSTGEGSLSRAQYHATSSTWVLGRRGYTLSFSTREGRENLVAVSRRLVTTVWFVVPAPVTLPTYSSGIHRESQGCSHC